MPRLRPDEREAMRQHLLSVMAEHPARSTRAGQLPVHPHFFSLHVRGNFLVASILVVLLLVSSGGTAMAAETALPGDLLYPVKVRINEPVRSAVTFTAEAKARWSARRVERRLDEAEQLIAAGRWNAETETALAASVQVQSQRAVEQQDQLRAGGKAQAAAVVSSQLEASLQAHQQVIERLQLTAGTDGTSDSALDVAVAAALDATAALRSAAETEVSGSPSVQAAAKGRRKAAAHKIEEVERFLGRKRAGTEIEADAAAQARLEDARQILVAGEAELEAEVFGDAFTSFQQSQRAAQEAKILLEHNFGVNEEVKSKVESRREAAARPPSATSTSPTATSTDETATSTERTGAATEKNPETKGRSRGRREKNKDNDDQDRQPKPKESPLLDFQPEVKGESTVDVDANVAPSPVQGNVNTNTNLNINSKLNTNAGLLLGQ